MKKISELITGSTISGTDQFNTDLFSKRINSTKELEWIQIAAGSQGGADSSFFHDTDPNYVYISQNMETSYMSEDGMTSIDTWQTISDEDANGGAASISQTYQMKFSLQQENYGLSVNAVGMFVTYDKGKTWRPFAQHQFPPGKKAKPLSALALDPDDHDIIYVGAGEFWQNKDPRTDATRYKTKFKNVAGSRIRGIIYKSLDGGLTWSEKTAGLSQKCEVGQIYIHPKHRNILYIATSDGVFISRDSGETYSPISNGLADPISNEIYLRDLAFHYNPENDQVTLVAAILTIWAKDENGVLIHTSGGIYKSLDEGQTWISLNKGLIVDYSPFRSPQGLGTKQGYNNGIAKWFGLKTKNDALAEDTCEFAKIPDTILPSFREVKINPVNPNIIYAINCGRKENSVEPEGVWITEDGGQNWFISTRIGSGYQRDGEYWKKQYAPADVDLTQRNVSVGGEEDWSWMFKDFYPMLAYQFFAVSPDGKTLIVHVFKSRIVSKDGGRTWNQVDSIEIEKDIWIGRGNSNVPGKYIFTQPKTQEVYFVSGETGFWKLNKTVDYSHLKTKAVPMERIDYANQVSCPGAAVAFHPHNHNTVYAVVDRLNHRGQFVMSTTGGTDWKCLSQIFDVPMSDAIKAYTLIIDKNDPNKMYFALPTKAINDVHSTFPVADENRGVYKTTNGGKTWKVSNHGIKSNPADVNAVSFSNDHKIIYAAIMSQDGGLYRSKDEAQNWEKMLLPNGVNSVNDIKVTASGRIIISTGHPESDLCQGGVYCSEDEGQTWKLIFNGGFIIDTVYDPKDESKMIVTMGGSNIIDGLNQGLYLTTDDGQSWVKINNGIGNCNKTTQVMFDPVDPKIVWGSSFASGFYKLVLPDDFSSANKTMTTED